MAILKSNLRKSPVADNVDIPYLAKITSPPPLPSCSCP